MSSPLPAAAAAMVVATSARLIRDTDYLLLFRIQPPAAQRLPVSSGSPLFLAARAIGARDGRPAQTAGNRRLRNLLVTLRKCQPSQLHESAITMTGKDREPDGSA